MTAGGADAWAGAGPVSRLAPSPTGALHLGNARTFLLTWLHVRALRGTLLLRIDDLDGPRVKTGAADAALEDLRWLGLDWDEAPGVLVQSERADVYAAAAERLVATGSAYPCVCTRTEVAAAASAPHGSEGPPYPGTCRGRWATGAEAERATGRPAALRWQVGDETIRFDDEVFGPQEATPRDDTGDFVIVKSNGTAAYQLATVVDDAASGVDLVIRGADLLPSTARQFMLQRALGLPHPRWRHLPLVVGPDGRRLAKRHGDTSIRHLRETGWTAPELVGFLGWTAGLAARGERVGAGSLVGRYEPAAPAALSRDPIVTDAVMLAAARTG